MVAEIWASVMSSFVDQLVALTCVTFRPASTGLDCSLTQIEPSHMFQNIRSNVSKITVNVDSDWSHEQYISEKVTPSNKIHTDVVGC